jgi:thiosulfate/3-mercaptopyruvate sulfurtransferase
VLGRAPRGHDPAVERIAADLRRGSFAVQVVDDIARWKAGKLLGNLAYNLDALYPPSELRDLAAAALVDEARAVFAVAGIEARDLRAATELNLSRSAVREIPGYAPTAARPGRAWPAAVLSRPTTSTARSSSSHGCMGSRRR